MTDWNDSDPKRTTEPQRVDVAVIDEKHRRASRQFTVADVRLSRLYRGIVRRILRRASNESA